MNHPGSYASRSLTHRLIPGGAHTYSKGDDQFPSNAPRFLERGEGAHVWDDQGRKFLDWTMGLRSMSLGYGVRPVLDAAIAQIEKGSNFGRPSRIETEFAQDIVDLIPCAEMVKYGKNGSTVTTAAVKLARAYTGRDYVALCRDHPFFSYDDWFIGTTPCKGGIPQAFSDLSLSFRYNDIGSLEKLFREHPGKISCVILEPAATEHPRDGFLQKVQALCQANGAVFILDEMITGFRWHLNGAQTYYGVQPDLATFGKGVANGFSLAFLVGKREIMELGGLDHSRERIFLISTTHGAENHSIAAARASIRFFRDNPVVEHMWQIGQSFIDGLNAVAAELGLGAQVSAAGVACSPYFVCRDRKGEVSLPLRTLFLQEMVRQGVLINYVAPSWSHTAADVERTLECTRKALAVYARALDEGWERHLEGAPIKPVFRSHN